MTHDWADVFTIIIVSGSVVAAILFLLAFAGILARHWGHMRRR